MWVPEVIAIACRSHPTLKAGMLRKAPDWVGIDYENKATTALYVDLIVASVIVDTLYITIPFIHHASDLLTTVEWYMMGR